MQLMSHLVEHHGVIRGKGDEKMKKNKIVVGLLTLLIFFAVVGLVQSQGTPFAIGGWVFDHEGNPVSGVTIDITNLETGSTTTSLGPTTAQGKWAADLANLHPNSAHGAGNRTQIVATAPDGRTKTTVVPRAAATGQIVNITLPGYGVNLTVNTTAQIIDPGVIATYLLTVNNTGNVVDSYTLTADNPDGAIASLDTYSITNLAAGANTTVLLSVTHTLAGLYRVNVTATSPITGVFDYVNTTTTVKTVYDVKLTVDKEAKPTVATLNATYSLTVNNTGNVVDSYTLTVDNPDSATVANLSTYTITNLAQGATAPVSLNVTNATAGTFRVNVTVVSQNDPTNATDYKNTTTTIGAAQTNTTTGIGTEEINATGIADTTILITTIAPTNVTIGNYTTNPGTGFTGNIGKYIDVHVPIGEIANVTNMTVKLFYTDADVAIAGVAENTLVMKWWDSSSWVQCSNTGVNTTNQSGYSGYIWATIDSTTTPKLTDLTGAPFGGGKDTTPPASVTNLKEVEVGQTWIKWTWNDPVDSDFSHVMVYVDGDFKENVSKSTEYYSATGLSAGTSYTIGTHTVDTVGNVNQTGVTDTATTSAAPRRPGGGGARVVTPTVNVPIDSTTGAVTETTTLTVEKAALTIPAGVIIKDAAGKPLSTSITTMHTPTTAERVGAIKAYDFGPSGTTFSPSIDLVIEYDPADIPAGFSESDLVIKMYDGTAKAWIDLDTTVDTAAHKATAKVSHFTIFALFAAPPVAPPPVTPTPTVPPVVTPTLTPTPTPPEEVKPPVKWGLIIGIIIAVVIVGAAAYYFYTKKKA